MGHRRGDYSACITWRKVKVGLPGLYFLSPLSLSAISSKTSKLSQLSGISKIYNTSQIVVVSKIFQIYQKGKIDIGEGCNTKGWECFHTDLLRGCWLLLDNTNAIYPPISCKYIPPYPALYSWLCVQLSSTKLDLKLYCPVQPIRLEWAPVAALLLLYRYIILY